MQVKLGDTNRLGSWVGNRTAVSVGAWAWAWVRAIPWAIAECKYGDKDDGAGFEVGVGSVGVGSIVVLEAEYEDGGEGSLLICSWSWWKLQLW